MGDESDSVSCESSLKEEGFLGNPCPRSLLLLIEKGLAKIDWVSQRVPVFHR